MNKVKSFVHLDFMTVKPYFTVRIMLLFPVLAFILSFFTGNISSAIGVGVMLGPLFNSYPFAVGEKSNMDALYVILSIGRKTVVLGRYVFALSLNICSILLSFIFGMAGLLTARVANFGSRAGEAFWLVILLAMLVAIIQAIQLPIFFKLGYAKAKFFVLVPFFVIMGCWSAFISIGIAGEFLDNLPGFFTNTLGVGGMVALAVLILLLLLFASYRLSLSFYKKREF
jgi:hypothetical protein